MALTFVSRTSLPELSRGATGKESITIHENGQLVLSGKVLKALGIEADTLAVMGFDTATRSLVVAIANPKLIKQVGGEAGCYKIRVNKKTSQGMFAASAFLQDPNEEIFGGDKYDYRGSGNQSFDATVDDKNKTVTINLPKGGLTKKPVVARAKKVKAETPGTPVAAPKANASDDGLEELVA